MEKIATRDAYGKTLAALGGKNEKIVALDADLSQSTKTVDFANLYPERFINVGIAEQNLMGMSAGIAATGKIPFASTFAIFAAGRAYEIIRNAICYPRLNVKVVATHAGLTVGEDGGSHQAIEDISLMRSLPNMTVIVPADGMETQKVIETVADYEGPVYVRLGRAKVSVLFDEDYSFEIGKSKCLSQGKDITIIACGIMVEKALEAKERLAQEGIEAEVINGASIKPFDEETLLQSVKKTGCVVSAEEHSVIGGLGSTVAEVLSKHYPAPLAMIGVQDVFGESGAPDELLEKYGLTVNAIYEAAKNMVEKKGM